MLPEIPTSERPGATYSSISDIRVPATNTRGHTLAKALRPLPSLHMFQEQLTQTRLFLFHQFVQPGKHLCYIFCSSKFTRTVSSTFDLFKGYLRRT
jgi:hypothetical protein